MVFHIWAVFSFILINLEIASSKSLYRPTPTPARIAAPIAVAVSEDGTLISLASNI